jgi:transposase
VEIITGIERRRRWRLEDKLRIIAETEQPGANVAEFARRHEISRIPLWKWRNRTHSRMLARVAASTFLSVQVVSGTAGPVMLPGSLRRRCPPAIGGQIEITLPDGSSVRVGNDVSLAALRPTTCPHLFLASEGDV